MKVYTLSVDDYEGLYGASIVLLGVFSSKELAEKRAEELGYPLYIIKKVEIDKPVDEYLGGYWSDKCL